MDGVTPDEGGFSASFFSCSRRCFSLRSSFVRNMSGTDMMSFALGTRITSSSLPQYDTSTTTSSRSCFPLLLSFYSSAFRFYAPTVLLVLRFAATPFFSSFSFGLSSEKGGRSSAFAGFPSFRAVLLSIRLRFESASDIRYDLRLPWNRRLCRCLPDPYPGK